MEKEVIWLILGALVVVVVITALALFFKNQIIDFFKGLSVGEPSKIFLAVIK